MVTDAPYRVHTPPRWLIAEFPAQWNVLSWAIVNGGFQRVSQVAWLFLQPNEIASTGCIREWTKAQARPRGLPAAVTFLTSRREHAWIEAGAREGPCQCWTIGTIGLSNALRVGDPVGPLMPPGTINLLTCLSHGVTTEAALELLALASEAKAAAVIESSVASRRTGLPSTGTGTDYLALAWPDDGEREPYGGKHTAIGSVVGRAVYDAVARGVETWREELLAKT